jgi:two-component system sensor histidine kinase AlgZ
LPICARGWARDCTVDFAGEPPPRRGEFHDNARGPPHRVPGAGLGRAPQRLVLKPPPDALRPTLRSVDRMDGDPRMGIGLWTLRPAVALRFTGRTPPYTPRMGSGSSNKRATPAKAFAPNWLPEFCSAPTLFAVMVVAELVALVVVLAPETHFRPWLPRLGVISVYVQWLALLNAVVLCSLRRPLQRLRVRTGFVVAWIASVAVTALASAVVCQMDQALGLGLSVPIGLGAYFVFANAAIAALIAAALLRYFFVLEQWRERVRVASKAQVDALQARIRPHFLFNSMNTIASLIRTRPHEAEQTVENLSDLFRAALGADDRHGTLGDELDLIQRYLDIERLRLGARLHVDFELADDLPRDMPLPRLLLQPLVENAVYHGVQPCANGGTLTFRARRVDGGVEIVVGNPRPADAPAPRNGVALANVRARIEYHFGTRAELRAQPAPANYTVRVRLPEAMIR